MAALRSRCGNYIFALWFLTDTFCFQKALPRTSLLFVIEYKDVRLIDCFLNVTSPSIDPAGQLNRARLLVLMAGFYQVTLGLDGK